MREIWHPDEIAGLLLFLLTIAAVYLSEAIILIRSALARYRKRPAKRILTTRSAIAVHVLAALGVLCFAYGRLIEPRLIEVVAIPVHTEKLKTTSFRLVLISDLHCNRKPLNENAMVTLVNNLQPDVVVFAGDALNKDDALPLFKRTMTQIKANLAKLAVRGNFETGRRKHLDLYSDTGFQLLDQDTVTLEKNGERIAVSGLRCDRPAALRSLLATVPPDTYSVFLHHWSDLIEDIGDLNVDLYLCGHTHGGQVALPFYGAVITLSKMGKKYESGLYHAGNAILYVNRGIGLENPPAPLVRFLARPEITVFDIQPKR